MSLLLQLLISVTVTTYVSLSAGLASGVCIKPSFSVESGNHTYPRPPVAFNCIDPPGHIHKSGPASAIGSASTFTVTESKFTHWFASVPLS